MFFHRFKFCIALLLGLCAPIQAQDERFEAPEIRPQKTLGMLAQASDSDQDKQLESIDGEAISGNAAVADPKFGEYGPVDSLPANPSMADQSPALTPSSGETVLSETRALPNEYKSELIYPDWLGKKTDNASPAGGSFQTGGSSPSSRRVRNLQPREQPTAKSMLKLRPGMNRFDSSSHEIVRERYADGSIKIVRTVTQDADGNYYNDGGWLMYDRQQRAIASGTYVRGAMEGDWQRVHEPGSGGLFSQMPFSLFEGPYLSRASFVRNKIDGVWTISDKSGELICSITYQQGVRNGVASWFYPGGKKMREANFKDGVPHGYVLQWDRQGKVQRREQFVDGSKVIRKKTTFANQTLASERVYRDRKLSPRGTDNWWAAKPATFDRQGDELQHGPVAQWYPNRQPKMTGRYVDGMRDGLFTWWHATHNKKAEGNFSKGQRTGLWRYWHESGMKRSEGHFERDRPVGMWRTWNPGGQIIEQKDFDKEPTSQADPDDGQEAIEEVVGEATSVVEDSDSPGFRVDLENGGSKPTTDESVESEPVENGDPFGEFTSEFGSLPGE